MFLFIFFCSLPVNAWGKGRMCMKKHGKKNWMQIYRLLHVCDALGVVTCGATTQSKRGNLLFRREKNNALFHRTLEKKLCACVALTLSNVLKALFYCLQRCLAFASCGTREGSEAVAAVSQRHMSSNQGLH